MYHFFGDNAYIITLTLLIIFVWVVTQRDLVGRCQCCRETISLLWEPQISDAVTLFLHVIFSLSF
jgi:hypothetical protein